MAQQESPCPCRWRRRHKFYPWVGKIPWSRKWQPSLEFLPGKVPWTEKPIGLQSVGSQRPGHDWACRHTRLHKHLGKFEEKHVTPKLSAWSLSLKDNDINSEQIFQAKIFFGSDFQGPHLKLSTNHSFTRLLKQSLKYLRHLISASHWQLKEKHMSREPYIMVLEEIPFVSFLLANISPCWDCTLSNCKKSELSK